ncbi:MAG TPA: bifunctional 4-hydroxy-2-oxoglutarate aldolase/2-dehydro-3-deoxy-phosphogluconate aldolase [Gemmatimonadaceae bacterium]|nr:bifunctional 4-hydroxy-2-oxoglutarate aldolase/2-dehydro-3-deoxy-phosphogluconate aldolase [Gemmatimonadaceae bacterium]
MDDLLTQLADLRVLPLIVIDDPADALPLARALIDGGLPCAEITFRTARAAEAIRAIADSSLDILLGAGTVLTLPQAAEARAAGARFIVTPGFNPAVVDYCLEHEIPVFPGVCTPTEVEAALRKGLDVLKFFPAEPMGGAAFLKAISAPYSMVRFIPTGGINLENLSAYFAVSSVVACGGSWLAPQEWIRAKNFARIREETERAVKAVRSLAGVGR